ncbi:MAG: hypothetical protein P4L22_03710 [Candidatus Babeliales bacterium]|nr:hypothetical protein [Candidatus Babeliales bacterium]
MKLNLRTVFCISMLFANILNATSCCSTQNNKSLQTVCAKKGNIFGKTFFSYRPQDSNVARRMVGVIDKMSKTYDDGYSLVSLGLQYQETFKRNKLAEFFAFNKNKSMSYGPTCNEFDIYGINLGTTATGAICLNPVIKNVIVDVDMCNNWDFFICGLWSRFTLPFVYSRNELNLKEACRDFKIPPEPFEKNLVTVDGFTGKAVPFINLRNAFDITRPFGSAPALDFGKITEKRHDAQIAGLHLELGYDFYKTEDCFVGAGLHFVAPTGTKPEVQFLFEAVCGANKSGQVGGTFHAGYTMWQSCSGDQSLALYFDSIVTHLFASKQRRLFGLFIDGKTSAGSSYLLLKKFDASGAIIGLERAANLLAIESKIKANVMADIALMLQYDTCNVSTGLGWNYWSRSCEIITDDYCNPFKGNDKYGIKGNSLSDNNSTESKSTIGTCSAIETNPVFLTNKDIDSSLALNPSTFSNKIFGFVGYNWNSCKTVPYVLLQAEVEIGNKNTAADQWSLLLKTGISF